MDVECMRISFQTITPGGAGRAHKEGWMGNYRHIPHLDKGPKLANPNVKSLASTVSDKYPSSFYVVWVRDHLHAEKRDENTLVWSISDSAPPPTKDVLQQTLTAEGTPCESFFLCSVLFIV
jgi:hypothetical protein